MHAERGSCHHLRSRGDREMEREREKKEFGYPEHDEVLEAEEEEGIYYWRVNGVRRGS